MRSTFETPFDVERIVGKVTEDLCSGKGLFEPLITSGTEEKASEVRWNNERSRKWLKQQLKSP
jgi:hypothetical protein